LLHSNIGETKLQAQEYIAYFDSFVKEAKKLKEANVRQLAKLQSQVTPESMSKLEEVQSMYQEIANALTVQLEEEERV
jgi:hypothetical protein